MAKVSGKVPADNPLTKRCLIVTTVYGGFLFATWEMMKADVSLGYPKPLALLGHRWRYYFRFAPAGENKFFGHTF